MVLDSKGFINTEPVNAPPSRQGVVNQLRFWGMGKVNSSNTDPELHNKMFGNRMKAQSRLARLENKAVELRMNNQKGLETIQAGAAMDQSQLAHDNFDQQEGDILGAAARGVAGTVGLLQGASQVSDSLGLKGVSKVLDSIPVIGRGKENERAQEAFEVALEEIRAGNEAGVERINKSFKTYGTMMTAFNNMITDMSESLTPELLELITPNVDLLKQAWEDLDELNEELGRY